MALLGKKKDSQNPVNILGEHIAAYLSWVKLGKSKFSEKEEVGKIFIEMESVRFLLEQAVAGTMYDYRRKLEPNVWAAAVNKYTGEMEKLKAALLHAVDECEAGKLSEEDMRKKAKQEAEEKAALEKLSVREQMALAEEKEKEEETYYEEERDEAEREALENPGKMTEADCRELWRIYQGLTLEMKEMQRIADRWIADNPQKGCLGMTLAVLALPVAAGCGLYQLL